MQAFLVLFSVIASPLAITCRNNGLQEKQLCPYDIQLDRNSAHDPEPEIRDGPKFTRAAKRRKRSGPQPLILGTRFEVDTVSIKTQHQKSGNWALGYPEEGSTMQNISETTPNERTMIPSP